LILFDQNNIVTLFKIKNKKQTQINPST